MKELITFTLSVINELEDEGRFGTAHVYRSTLNAFTAYWQEHHHRSTIPMKAAFTAATLKGFECQLQQRLLKLNTISTYMRMLRAIYHRALRKNFATYIPVLFDHVYTGTRADVKRALPPSDMGQLLQTVSPEDELEETRLWFALLFILRGMPFVDLAQLRKCDLQDNFILYRRRKTGRLLTIKLTPQAVEIIHRCTNLNPKSPYLLSILRNDENSLAAPLGSRREYQHYQNILRRFNRRLKKLARILRIPGKISSYTARHTWATIAFHRKCTTGIISNALGHSSIKVTETYLKPFDDESMDRTNRMIISYTKKSMKANILEP